jgi:gamma-glutamylcyclotransferase (GGCT)/AIG2-like uncharacterized protein YtfP
LPVTPLAALQGRTSRFRCWAATCRAVSTGASRTAWTAGVLGYPALILDADGSLIDVDVFESPTLPRHRHRLDAFEGPGYRRVAVDVATAEGVLPASIYVLGEPTKPS